MNRKRHHGWVIALAFLGLIPTVHAQHRKGVHVQVGKIEKGFGGAEFYIGDELVTRYNTLAMAKPTFWPLNAPGGIPLTRNYPPPEGQATDHPHQKSGWFCHGDVIPEGIELKSKIRGVEGVDFWSEAKGHGEIRTRSISFQPTITAKNEWLTADGQKIMDDNTTIALHDFGKARLIVVNIDLHASVCPITFGDTKEGSFGIRINDVINAGKNGKGKIQNAEGIVAEKIANENANKTWGLKSAWCDYSGPIDGKVVGLAILDDPKNPYPACWHVRGYGLMAANPFGRTKHAQFPAMKGNDKLVRLEKGQHLQLRYGMLLHTGDAVSGEVAAHFKTFVELREKE
jgi:hypothetical protein